MAQQTEGAFGQGKRRPDQASGCDRGPGHAFGQGCGARARLGGSGRLVIRRSGTEPVIRVMGEGDDRDLVNSIVDDVVEAVTRAA